MQYGTGERFGLGRGTMTAEIPQVLADKLSRYRPRSGQTRKLYLQTVQPLETVLSDLDDIDQQTDVDTRRIRLQVKRQAASTDEVQSAIVADWLVNTCLAMTEAGEESRRRDISRRAQQRMLRAEIEGRVTRRVATIDIDHEFDEIVALDLRRR